MILVHFVIALILALLLTLLITRGFRRRGPWPAVWPLLVLILLASWAGGMWVQPFGPMIWGVSLLPFVIVAGLVALFFVAMPRQPHEQDGGDDRLELVTRKEQYEREHQDFVLGWLFWALALLLMLSIIVRYLLFPPLAV
ncbi:DUF4175 domain-containing protein [Oceanidesulfovibrio marinus]|uniref:DUF4175 domain-containing protein n=1 Tax=Oceanidesulfovibrio marinus TaxID=370038 RepID=A0A6P1ZE13_9BACT|nr:DUF4175 domain-containing protein [Oceanidesulfovibrio marinus]QJT10773.1 DUF4175 domain-containing protein [Oceanidesulfovibrio marinus]TVM31924.1 hypothetical protein DQK91_17115 [Oceanidesulfovibrio marinus]